MVHDLWGAYVTPWANAFRASEESEERGWRERGEGAKGEDREGIGTRGGG